MQDSSPSGSPEFTGADAAGAKAALPDLEATRIDPETSRTPSGGTQTDDDLTLVDANLPAVEKVETGTAAADPDGTLAKPNCPAVQKVETVHSVQPEPSAQQVESGQSCADTDLDVTRTKPNTRAIKQAQTKEAGSDPELTRVKPPAQEQQIKSTTSTQTRVMPGPLEEPTLVASDSLLMPEFSAIDVRLQNNFKLAGVLAAVPVLVAGILSLGGWICDIDALRSPFGEPGLRSAAAINAILLGVAALLVGTGSSRTWHSWLGSLIGAIVMVGGAANFIEHLFELHWDNFVIYELTGSPSITYPGPLMPYDALSFALCGASVVLFDVLWKQKWRLSELAAALVFVPNFIILCFYLVGQSHLCVYLGCVKFSPVASLVFLLICFEILFLAPERGFVNIFSRRNAVGMFSRRTLISVGFVLLLLFARQCVVQVVPPEAIGDVNMITAVIVLLAAAGFAWWSLRRVSTEEIAKHQAHEEIKQKEHVIEQKDQEIHVLQSGVHASVRHLKLVCLECGREFTDQNMTNCPDDDLLLVRIMDNLRPGALFGERYRIQRELGSGGMSTVYLARHELMNKDVAVKVLQMQYSSDAKMIQRFQREARAASSLSHPNLVAVYDFNVTTDGQAFMVMEFLQGCSLIDFVHNGGPIPWVQAVPLFLQILDGLNHAHANGVIHRDLKPGNVMLQPVDGEQGFVAKIVDFGFAKAGEEMGQQLTRTGEVFGSPLYMSPEQCQGIPMDKRSDLYALGCIMYVCLTGNPPFTGNNIMETLSMHMNASPPAMPESCDVPAWLERVVQKLLEKEPGARFQSAVDVIVALNVGMSTMTIDAAGSPVKQAL
jgi:tRNA A-37 threonylcarbamoyl transferase component Bud32